MGDQIFPEGISLKGFYQELEKNSFILSDELREYPQKNGVH
jgi:hypothetical protein